MIKFNQATQWFKEWMPGLIFFAVMGGPLSLGLAAQTNSPMNAFSLSANANASASNTDLIEVSISIKNVSDKPVEIITIQEQQPFSVQIYYDRGVLIGRDKRLLIKNNTQKESKLHFMPGEMKNYKTTLSTVKDAQGKDDRLPPGTYSVQVVFPVVSYVEGKYVTELIKSEPVKVEVKLKETIAWGEPVEGVSVRLRADKTKWATNETPTFKLDVRNQGQREFYTRRAQESGRLEVDGVWYDWTGPIDLKGSSPLPPGLEYHDIPVSLESNWEATQEWRDKTQAPPPRIPLKLLSGKHTIRFAAEIITVKPEPHNNFVPSNPVEIEIWSNPVQ